MDFLETLKDYVWMERLCKQGGGAYLATASALAAVQAELPEIITRIVTEGLSEMDMDKLKEFVTMQALKKAQEAELEETKAYAKALEEVLVPMFEAAGVSTMKVDGVTVFLYSQKWAGVEKTGDEVTPAERQRAVKALKDAGLDIYVKEDFNTQSLSAFVREALGEAPLEVQMDKARWYEVLPPTFAGTIAVTEKTNLRTRGIK